MPVSFHPGLLIDPSDLPGQRDSPASLSLPFRPGRSALICSNSIMCSSLSLFEWGLIWPDSLVYPTGKKFPRGIFYDRCHASHTFSLQAVEPFGKKAKINSGFTQISTIAPSQNQTEATKPASSQYQAPQTHWIA